MKMHTEICKQAKKWVMKQGFGVALDDSVRAWLETGEQPDVIAWRSNASLVIEVKVSRSDFLAEKKKPFRKNPKLGMGDWRFYLSPPGVIQQNDLPEGWGLLHILDNGKIEPVVGWPPNTEWGTHKPFFGNKASEMAMMYSALRRQGKG